MKEASVYSSYDLEHLKGIGLHLFDKGPAKKIYSHLHKMLKGELDPKAITDGKLPGLGSAPGQKIRSHDYRKGAENKK